MPEVALAKDAGAAKELHDADLAAMALPVLDMDAYVADFGRTVVPGYRRGIADAEFPADAGLARSIIPPGTSATRDFSRLAPRIPDVLMDMCVGCMACVNACPDSAILACVVPESQVAPAVETFAASQPQPAVAARRADPPLRSDPEIRRRAGASAARSAAPSGCSSTPATARAARSASRSARRWATTRSS